MASKIRQVKKNALNGQTVGVTNNGLRIVEKFLEGLEATKIADPDVARANSPLINRLFSLSDRIRKVSGHE